MSHSTRAALLLLSVQSALIGLAGAKGSGPEDDAFVYEHRVTHRFPSDEDADN